MSGNVLDELLRRGATFAAFREPGHGARVLVQLQGELKPAVAGDTCFTLCPFESFDGNALCIRPDIELNLDDDRGLDRITGTSTSIGRVLHAGLDRAGYREAVAHAVMELRSGRAQKVVLARTIDVNLGSATPGGLFAAACEAQPGAFVALVNTDRFGTWLGASPERLLLMEDDRFEVDALAGTMPTDQAPADPAAWGEKEREEQALVTQEVLARLTRAGATIVQAAELTTHRAGRVTHLHNRITGSSPSDPLSIAQALHPTPAVGGRPRDAASTLIAALEPRPRALYAGYWGPIDRTRAALYVNIRCIEIAGDRALLHVGAGITSQSDPDLECDEVELKARLWLDLLHGQGAGG
ncbi:MAG: chorismate-binding protein [Flavobacteriales bacterium]|nr:chorismate-binding protein [Flavobacteriales bacterium]